MFLVKFYHCNYLYVLYSGNKYPKFIFLSELSQKKSETPLLEINLPSLAKSKPPKTFASKNSVVV